MKKFISTPNAPAAVGPYSQAVIKGDTLYVSGQIPLDPATGKIVEGGIEEQAVRAFENVKAILIEAGYDFTDVVQATVMLDNLDDFAAMNSIYTRYFTEQLPPRVCYEVARLPLGALVEVVVTAVK